MMKRILIVLCVIAFAGCNAQSNDRWDNSSYSTEAERAPSSLTAEAGSEEGQIYRPYTPPGESAEIYGYDENNQPENKKTSAYRAEASRQRYEQQQNQMGQQQENAPSDFNTVIGQNTQNDYMYQAQEPVLSRPALPPVKVAILLPLSGPHEDLGQAMLQAAQLALFDMGYDAFELMPRDTRGTTQGATQATQSAITAGAQFILGPLFASSVRAAKPIASRYNINMVAFSTDWSLAGGNTYIMGFLPFAQVQRVAEYAVSSGYQNIGILAPNTDYGNAVVAAYNSMAYRTGLGTADVVRFSPDSSDTSALLRDFTKYDERVQALEEQKVVLNSQVQQGSSSAKAELARLEGVQSWGEPPFQAVLLPVGGDQARSIGNLLSFYDLGPQEVKRLGTGLWDDPGLATEPALDGAWFAAPSPDLRKSFERKYRDLYGTRPQRLATLAYDATALAAVIAKKSYNATGRASFERRELVNPNGYAGIDGIFRFRPDGLVERGLAVLEYQDAKIKVIDPAPTTFQRIDY